MCVCVGYVYISEVAGGGQKRALGSLEMNLQVDVNNLTWIL